jgi:ABC-type enterobactin transport system permease subunit
LIFAIHITQGQADIQISTIITAILSPDNTTADNLVRYVRLPRGTIGVIAGAALGIAVRIPGLCCGYLHRFPDFRDIKDYAPSYIVPSGNI